MEFITQVFLSPAPKPASLYSPAGVVTFLGSDNTMMTFPWSYCALYAPLGQAPESLFW